MGDFISTFIFLQDFDCISSIDCMFEKIIKENWEVESIEVNKSLIVVFLRTNFKIKTEINNYEKFLNKSILYLKSKNIDPNVILNGIIKETK